MINTVLVNVAIKAHFLELSCHRRSILQRLSGWMLSRSRLKCMPGEGPSLFILDLLVKEDDRLIANYCSKSAALLFANLCVFSDLFITYDRLSVFLRPARR
jgi:hypothetical protein